MMYKQLHSGKPTRPPTPTPSGHPIFVAQPVDHDNIIDVIPDSRPPVWPHTPTPPSTSSDFANPYSFTAPPVSFHTTGFSAPPSAGPTPAVPTPTGSFPTAPSTFPANFAVEYEKYQQKRQSTGNFGINVDQVDSHRVIVSFYGSRAIVALFFLGIMLIGFSLDKVPDLLPYLWELVF